MIKALDEKKLQPFIKWAEENDVEKRIGKIDRYFVLTFPMISIHKLSELEKMLPDDLFDWPDNSTAVFKEGDE